MRMRSSLRAFVLLASLAFCFITNARSQTAPIRIMPLGDSITYGSGGTANLGGYRGTLYTLLTNAGYSVDYVGTQTANSSSIPDQDHEGHSGWRIDQLDSNIVGWFNAIADPDVILLHIGTNDFGQNNDTVNAINRLDALITKMATLRPYAHIIVTNLMERNEPYNTLIQTQFNPFVQDRVNAQAALGRRVTFLDMRSVVPLSDMPDQLHPNQTGYDKMANAWLPAIQAVIAPNGDSAPPAIARARGNADRTHVSVTFSKPVADSAATVSNYSIAGLSISAASLDSSKRIVTLTTSAQTLGNTYTITVNNVLDRSTPTPNAITPNSTVNFQTSIPRGYLNNIPESAGYTLVYSIDLPTAAAFRYNVPYSINNRNGVGPFSRVAYYLELQTSTGELQYAWVSMDGFTTDASKIGIPDVASGATFQQGVTGMNVVSNVPGVTTGTGLTGNIEFWPTNYGPENTPSPGVTGASDSIYDFGDHPTPGTYGSMQVHNTAAGQTVFAFNNWGATGTAGDADLGIGNDPAPVTNGLDWTFHHNAASYTIKTLQVLVQTTGDFAGPTLTAATSTPGATQIIVSFSEPIAAGSVNAANFTISNGVSVLSARLAANQRDVILGTSAQPVGTSLTVTVSGIRDTSPSANVVTPLSSIAVSAPSLPPEIVANVGAAATNYQLLYSLDLPASGNFNAQGANAYRFDDRVSQIPFSRVAYYLELQQGTGTPQYVWASMDAFTAARSKLGIPTSASGAVFQQNISNLEVISNVSGVVNETTATGGNIEFWPNDYSAPNAANVPNASATAYDTGDTRSSGGGFGSMQIHNHDANQPVMCINHFGTDGNTLDIGIGAQATNNPDWTFAANAGNYTRRILHVLVLPGSSTPASLVAKVPEAASYQLAYSLTIPASGNVTSLIPSVNDGAVLGPFKRVAYYLELQTGTATPDYVWTSMDAFTSNGGQIAVPTAASGAIFQQNVSNLNVFSNVAGIVTGTGLAGGNIEFWPTNYSAGNALNVPNASGSLYDFGDTRTATGTYGCMQVHNHDASQTLFAFNNWGASSGSNTFCLGIGNNPAPVNGGVDWTFANNATNYSNRLLQVYILPGDNTAPTIASARGSATLNRLVITFNEAISEDSANVANFSIPGLTVTGAMLLPSQREIAVYTSPQTPGTVYTVNCTGVRDRTAGNVIAAGASTTFTAFTAPAVLSNIAETSGYKLIYQLSIPAATPQWNLNPIPYTVDESRYGEQLFDRVAYCLELDGNYVYTSFDPFTNQLAKIGVPTLNVTSTAFQQNITHLNVFSNVSGITTGTDLSGGNIEFWGGNYQAANALNIPNASATTYDFGDQMTTGTYGSMQVHNHDASQTLFAYNNWGTNTGTNSDLGFGNNPSPVNNGVDWTFSANAPSYTTRRLYVLVHPGGTGAGTPQFYSQPVSRSVSTGSNVTFAVSATGPAPLSYQWRFNGAPITGATNSWIDVNGVSAAQVGTYDVVVTSSGGASATSLGASLSLSGNGSPTFAGYAFTTQRNTGASIPRGAITAKASDPENDPLTVSNVSAASAQGGTVSLNASSVQYTPPANFLGTDSFSVTISDGHGGNAIGTVTANVSSLAPNAFGYTTLAIRGDGKLDALFYGTVGKSYEIQRSIDLSSPANWITIQTIPANDDGTIPFTDPNPPASGKAFYRTKTTIP